MSGTVIIGQDRIQLPVKLSDEDRNAINADISALYVDAHNRETNLADINKVHKEAIKELWASANRAAGYIIAGEWPKLVQVEYVFDGEDVTTVRTDTGEILSTRKATPEEMERYSNEELFSRTA